MADLSNMIRRLSMIVSSSDNMLKIYRKKSFCKHNYMRGYFLLAQLYRKKIKTNIDIDIMPLIEF